MPMTAENAAKSEYEYAWREIHLRLEFNRRIIYLQVLLIAAVIGSITSLIANKVPFGDLVPIIKYSTFGLLCIDLAFVFEIRQNSLHTIISGNYIIKINNRFFDSSYIDEVGGFLPSLRKDRERANQLFRIPYIAKRGHYVTDSFLFLSLLIETISYIGFAWSTRISFSGNIDILLIAFSCLFFAVYLILIYKYVKGDPDLISE